MVHFWFPLAGAGEVYIKLGILTQTQLLEGRKPRERSLEKMEHMVEQILRTAPTSSLTWNQVFELWVEVKYMYFMHAHVCILVHIHVPT